MLVLYILGYLFLYIILILLVILLAVLLIPFKYYFEGEKLETSWFDASVSWLFGGVRMYVHYNSESKFTSSLRIMGIHKKMSWENKKVKDDSKEQQKGKETNKPNKQKSKVPYSYLTYPVLEKGFQSILKLLNHCKPVKFKLKAKVGFEDPMYTGMLCAFTGIGFTILDKYDINLQPDFEDEKLEGCLTIGGRIQLFYLLLVAMEFVLTKPFRPILIKNMKTKIKRRMRTWQTLILKKT